MATNPYFTQGTANEQNIVEDLIIESLKIYGKDLYYIPRTLVSKDEILGEDRLSKFINSYPCEMYFENVDSFEGQGAFIQKFGLMMEQSATLVIARKRWEQLVGVHGTTILPNRPCEGDLIYYPLTKGLFEIKFVKHQDPFYQLGKLYVYKLQVELFQYSSEKIDTGIDAIDEFESLKTFSTDPTRSPYGEVLAINVTNSGSSYESTPQVQIISNSGTGATAVAVMGTQGNQGEVVKVIVTNPGSGYKSIPTIQFVGGSGFGAQAVAVVETDIDKVESFGDNNKFKTEAADIVFSKTNPFGEVDIRYTPTVPTNPTYTPTADSSLYTVDLDSVTADSL
jgi:hypothetical protein